MSEFKMFTIQGSHYRNKLLIIILETSSTSGYHEAIQIVATCPSAVSKPTWTISAKLSKAVVAVDGSHIRKTNRPTAM